jgi:hypothetical protein
MSEEAPAARPNLIGAIARWLGAALLIGAVGCWLTGVPGAGLLFIGGALASIVGMVFAAADNRARPEGAPAPPPSAMLALLIFVMAVATFLLGAGHTMGSAPSSANDFLIEGVALAAALVLFVLGIVAVGAPRVRRGGAFVALATFGALLAFSLAIA